MGLILKDVVPWGRTYAEYRDMFALQESDLSRKILGCGDGPASFNTEWTAKGGDITSVDPIYIFSKDDIQSRIDQTYTLIMEQMAGNTHQYNWTHIQSLEILGETRLKAMQTFLLDYEEGQAAQRYIAGGLPVLPFVHQQFDLALCSHFLFLYSEQRDLQFHLQSITELIRVAHEVRIFPLVTLDGQISPFLKPVIDQVEKAGLICHIKQVDYEFQKGGNTMLQILRQ